MQTLITKTAKPAKKEAKKKLTNAEKDKLIKELSEQANRNIAYKFMFNYLGNSTNDTHNRL
ncbi:hypothetical protein [Capnocytophaga leadbetteri]|jgi:hypothetical protein|uniref:hypothetical protein n=1 Tax=Capnocytophaga leadbetteri TaxID=327575 RepID=UPI0026EE15D4|nr:hypothetical protein [Capnocytophaga leadbetteri]